MILDKEGLLLPDFLPDNRICYTMQGAPKQTLSAHPFLPNDRFFIECSISEIMDLAFSLMPVQYKPLAKYSTSISDHCITICAPIQEIAPELLKEIYSDCINSVCRNTGNNTLSFDVWLKDFHTDIRLSWTQKK